MANALEKNVNTTNTFYRRNNKCYIKKIETPLIYTNKGVIAQQSSVDYSGVLKGGKAVFFECKETENKKSFPLGNLKQHQVFFLDFVNDLGAETFYLIHFKKVHEDVYKAPTSFINQYYHNAKNNDGRKSIPIGEFKNEWLVDIGNYLSL